jgi:hypothetical protein
MWKLLSRLFIIALFSSITASCNVPLFGYPHFWDYSKTRPKDGDLVGTYQVSKLRLPSELVRTLRADKPSVILEADHTALFRDYPEFDGFGDKLTCRLSGSANWSLDNEINSGWGWSVVFENFHPATSLSTSECRYENSVWGILILGRNAPYRLYDIVGDPDGDNGFELGRVPQ